MRWLNCAMWDLAEKTMGVRRATPLTARRGGTVRPTITLTPIAPAADEKHHAATRAKTLTGGNVHDQARQKKTDKPLDFHPKKVGYCPGNRACTAGHSTGKTSQ